MLLQVGRLDEALLTQITSIGPFTGMNASVFDQTPNREKSCGTFETGKLFLLSVQTGVHIQITFVPEPRRTLRTWERPFSGMNTQVADETQLRAETRGAD